ncbi:MAG: hypothetical protein LBC96_03125 [Lachnospiraceae bacterium]|jgi:CheY-specific phosphatase CheX|nr:hypothetical protein [Lachnospiraceae bacterium]
MVAQVIGSYLIERGIITKGQMMIIQKERKRLRARLGLVAISEGYMGADEVKSVEDQITDIHASDRAFADAAIAAGYLSMGQISTLAAKQGDSFLCFVQMMEKMGITTIDALEEILYTFDIIDNNAVQLDDLKSNDVTRIVPLFMPAEAARYINAAVVAVRYLESKVNSNIYPQKKAYLTDSFSSKRGVFQYAKGDKEYAYALVAGGEEMSFIATAYSHERHNKVNDEVLEIVGAILNRISASYAAELGQGGIIFDLLPPQIYDGISEITAEEMLVLPLSIRHDNFFLLISMSGNFTVKIG